VSYVPDKNNSVDVCSGYPLPGAFIAGWSDPTECRGNELSPRTAHSSVLYQGRAGQPRTPPTAPHRDTG